MNGMKNLSHTKVTNGHKRNVTVNRMVYSPTQSLFLLDPVSSIIPSVLTWPTDLIVTLNYSIRKCLETVYCWDEGTNTMGDNKNKTKKIMVSFL